MEGRGVGVYGAVGGDISDAEKANLEKKAEKFGLTPKWKQEGGTSPEKK